MLQLKNVCKKFNKQTVLSNINYSFSQTGLYYLLGESGSGKTTLVNIIARIDQQDSGEVLYNGLDLTSANNKMIASYRHSIVGMVFQNFNLIPNFSVNDNFNLVNGRNEQRHNYFKQLLIKFGVAKLLTYFPHQISGGEQQRIALARTLAFNHKIILADEPTGSLDPANAGVVMKELVSVSKDRLVIVITHDLELTSKYSGTIIKIDKGKLIGKSSRASYFGSVNLIGKKIDHLVILKNALRSIKIRKLHYGMFIMVTTLILSSLLIIVSAFTGFRSYSEYLSSIRIDANYFSVYKYVNQESVYFEVEELGIDISNLEVNRDYEVLFNDYFKQIYMFPENEFYELKIVNEIGDKFYVNSLFNNLHPNSLLKLEGDILVPFKDNNKLSYEKIEFIKDIRIDRVVQETSIYNVAKVYMSFDYFLALFEEVKLPLIAKQMNLVDLSFNQYHLMHEANIGLYGQRFQFDKYSQRRKVSEALALTDNVYTFFNSPLNKDFFQLRLNDEIFETTLSELMTSLELIVSILVATLAFTLINIGALVISYSFRKRKLELSILKVFGSTNFELVLNLVFEVAIIAMMIMFLTAAAYLSAYIFMKLLISNGYLIEFNYLPVSAINIVQILTILMLVLTLGSLDTLRNIFRINLGENLRHD
jgi:ABC-type lipoprotein export system ATPase subunit